MSHITVKQFYLENKSRFQLDIITGEDILDKKKITVSEINRPGLALAGFFDYFPAERVQIFGKTEFTYLRKIGRKKALAILNKLFSRNICLAVISRGIEPGKDFIKAAERSGTPVMSSHMPTTKLGTALVLYSERKLAPKMTAHATLVDVYGIGVMIMGKSGTGKSEIALELVKRGHRLVGDDLIEVTRVSDEELEGRGLNIVRHHMEIRGLGIIDVRNLFGIGAVRDSQKVELMIMLEEWEKGKDYERLGIEEKYGEILGVKVPKIVLPVKPGRNLSVIVEVAAMTQRLKNKGYNPAKELNRVIIEQMKKEPQ